MIRRFKCIIIAACALVLMALVVLQFKGHSISTIRESISVFHTQEVQSNNSTPSIPVTPAPVLYFTTAPIHNPVPSDNVLQQMSHKDLQVFYHSYINSPQTTCSKVERMGKLTDGGWEFCDENLYRPPKGDCLVYSFGINFDFSYDDDMAAYGCEVHAFDPSMNTAPNLHGDRVYFHPTGVGAKNTTISIAPKYEEWQLYTIGSHRRILQHAPEQRQLHTVKMDVEGYELDSLMTALDEGSLSDVRQLSFETHVAWGRFDPTKDNYIQFLRLLRKVYEKGFRIYLTHRNYVYSAFDSLLEKGKKRAYCHEIHTINSNFKNVINADGSVVGDGAVSDDKRRERHNQQMQLLSKEQQWYSKRQAQKRQQPKA
uniref:Methyltransferase domain-containing protein n=1 Tax=Arion vulgaris TaxID=1028688 RepID=A0A0B6ZJN4_9EUPU